MAENGASGQGTRIDEKSESSTEKHRSHGFVTSFGAHIVATNLPSYAELVGAGAFMIGLPIAVYDFAELFAPFARYTADRRGMKLTLLVGLVVFILGSLLFLVIAPRFLLLVRLIQGLGAAALSTVSITLVAKYFTAGRGRPSPIRQTVLVGLFLAALAVATIPFTSVLPLILEVIVAGLGVGTVWTQARFFPDVR